MSSKQESLSTLFARKNQRIHLVLRVVLPMEDKIRILIVDDEATWLHSISVMVQSLGYEVTAMANNLTDALTLVNEGDFDLAILDIGMEKENTGIKLGTLIKNTLNKPFIFITGSLDHSLEEVANAGPSAYLIKPTSKNGLYIAIQNAIDNFLERREITSRDENITAKSFFSKKGKKYVKVFWKDVVSLRSDEKYTVLETADSEDFYIRSSLQNTIKHIVPRTSEFVQIRRGQYISIHHIAEMTTDTVIASNKKNYGVSENFLAEVKRAINIIS